MSIHLYIQSLFSHSKKKKSKKTRTITHRKRHVSFTLNKDNIHCLRCPEREHKSINTKKKKTNKARGCAAAETLTRPRRGIPPSHADDRGDAAAAT